MGGEGEGDALPYQIHWIGLTSTFEEQESDLQLHRHAIGGSEADHRYLKIRPCATASELYQESVECFPAKGQHLVPRREYECLSADARAVHAAHI